ncbi:TSUP family transporter [Comamonas testosteroni]|uniref:TSUP family transporter n=1 Tax=Comamonas testosteroni TaxID=285 RepID=UPI000AB15EB1
MASILGVAGDELLIPTLVILFGADIRLASSLPLAVSLPTMIVDFTRYSRDGSFAVLKAQKNCVVVMALGSLCGAWIGGLLLGVVHDAVLLPMFVLILLISSVKVWRHKGA